MFQEGHHLMNSQCADEMPDCMNWEKQRKALSYIARTMTTFVALDMQMLSMVPRVTVVKVAATGPRTSARIFISKVSPPHPRPHPQPHSPPALPPQLSHSAFHGSRPSSLDSLSHPPAPSSYAEIASQRPRPRLGSSCQP